MSALPPAAAAPATGTALQLEIERTYQECATGLFRYAYTLTRDEELARDALQEAFLRLFALRREGHSIHCPKAWLYRVLRNHVLDSVRTARARLEVGVEELHNAPDESQNPERNYTQAEAERRLWSRLAPRELECLRLRAEGLSYEEIAEVLGVRSGTVGAFLARAHKKLREELERTGAGRAESTRACLATPR